MYKYAEMINVCTDDGRVEIMQIATLYDHDLPPGSNEHSIHILPEQVDLLVAWLLEAKKELL